MSYIDPVCGKEVHQEQSIHKVFRGASYHFCSQRCHDIFSQQAEVYLGDDVHIDPVCGMKVSPLSRNHERHEQHDYYFCSQHCVDAFLKSPDDYKGKDCLSAHPKKSKIQTDDPNAMYFCPMCPGQEQQGPGICKVCGMALESSAGPSLADAEDNPELIDMTQRLKLSLSLSIPLFLIAMIAELMPSWLPNSLTMFKIQWLEFLLATPVVLWCGWPFFQRFAQSLQSRNLNMFTLVGLGIGVAWLYSCIALFFPWFYPAQMHNDQGLIDVYFEASAMITSLVLLGQVLELKARSKTNEAIQQLLGLSAKTARIVTDDGRELDVAAEQVIVGNTLRIRPGEKIPVDGIMLDGQAWIDESMISGESAAVEKKAGDRLIGSSMNGQSSFLMRAEKIGSDTMLSQIVHMVAEAQRSRTKIQGLSDTVASYFVPTVVGIACLSFLIWLFFAPEPALAYATVNAIAVLIIACPCALGLATPMSIMVATGRGARSGIFIKQASALEQLENIDTLVVDKTGTLTQGKTQLKHLENLMTISDHDFLCLAASLEQGSEHPLAKALLASAKEKQCKLHPIRQFHAQTGQGVLAIINDEYFYLGNAQWMQEHGISVKTLEPLARTYQSQAETVVYLAKQQSLLGLLSIADPIKENSVEAVQKLQNMGIELLMLTGDDAYTAQAIGQQLGIKNIHAKLLPAHKASIIESLQAKGKIVAMAGDGINDAPALTQANVGIAMGTGSDIAIESADITLLHGDLMGIVKAQKLSKACMRNIRQNLFFAFAYNSAGIPIAAGLLYPSFGLLLSPMIAAAAMSLSSVSVIGNALRLRRQKMT